MTATASLSFTTLAEQLEQAVDELDNLRSNV